jgi:hypothetical protein
MENPEILLARLDERQIAMDEKLDSILTQVTKTNGRVDRHDTDIGDLKNWKHEVKGNVSGGKFVATLVSSGIGSIIGYIAAMLFR